MSWWEYVQRVAGTATQTAIADRTGIAQSSINRWRNTSPKPENAVAFARAYRRPVLEALIEAGVITADEAKLTEVPADASKLDTDALLAEIRSRIPD